MIELTSTELTLLVTGCGLLGGLVAWIGKGVSFLLIRWWTKAPKREDTAYYLSIADLGSKLRENGMTMSDVLELESLLHDPVKGKSQGAQQFVTKSLVSPDEPEQFISNVAMKARMAAAYDVAKAQYEQAITDLRLLSSQHESEAIDLAEKHWIEYRAALENCALREYDGGTHAPLAMLFAGLAETERRTEEIKAQISERSSR